MSAKRWAFLLALAVFSAIANPYQADANAADLTVAHISRGEQVVTSASDVTERALDGTVLRHGVQAGEKLPDDVRVEVPANVTLVIASGKSTITLSPGSIATFHYTGTLESVAIGTGRTTADDPLDFFRVSGHGIVAAAHGTVYSFVAGPASVAIVVTEGAVEATRVSIGSGPKRSSTRSTASRQVGAHRSPTLWARNRRAMWPLE
jgi:hypothetical protein